MSELNREFLINLSSSRYGQGNPRLGESLMKSFLTSLGRQDPLPDAILLSNSAVILACKDSTALEELGALEKAGVEILVNEESLAFYSLEQSLLLGKATSLSDMTQRLAQGGQILMP